jgi:hypothetical protein
MLKKHKDKLLDYAIERINQYDEEGSFKKMKCVGCWLSSEAREPGYSACDVCPFNTESLLHREDMRDCNCGERGAAHRSPRNRKAELIWKNMLIKALKRWCKKFYPEYKIIWK